MSRIIFELNDVSVHFNKRSIRIKSLREAVGFKLNKKPEEKTIALNRINLTISEGEHIGVIGRNGAGKSTLLKILTKVITPSSGSILFKKKKHIIPLLELGIGFQGDLSGRENCFIAGLLMGYTIREIKDKLDSIISFSELGSFIDEPVKYYSSGMYARLAFAIATDINPEVLLIDEVFGVGDEFFMRKCNARMQDLMQNGITTVFVSHNIDFLISQCTRLIWMDKGEVVMDGYPHEVAREYRQSDTDLKLLMAE